LQRSSSGSPLRSEIIAGFRFHFVIQALFVQGHFMRVVCSAVTLPQRSAVRFELGTFGFQAQDLKCA
jgi:hypothetical protein